MRCPMDLSLTHQTDFYQVLQIDSSHKEEERDLTGLSTPSEHPRHLLLMLQGYSKL